LDGSYLWVKTLHLFGVVVFLGNIIVTAWWKLMADRTRDPRIIAFAQRQVTLTDYVFTAGGAAILLAAGWGNAASHGMDVFHIHWLSWSVWLLSATGLIWVAILIPIQVRQARMAQEFSVSGAIPAEYWRLGRLWAIWGFILTLLPLVNLYWMVMKPA
jgi:uncharacterized membrane protein